MNNEPNPEPSAMWRELNDHVFTVEASGDAARDWREICELTNVGLPPLSFRLHTPSGITHDYIREDAHHRLQAQAALRAQDAAHWRIRILMAIERAAASGRLFDCALWGTLGTMGGMAIAAALTWAPR